MSEHIEQTHDDSVVRENDRKIVEGIENHTRPITDQTQSSSIATSSPFDGSCDHRDIRTFYTSELDYLVAMRKRYACANCATATGECSSCQRTRERIEELQRAAA